jgi:hypothetical protein
VFADAAGSSRSPHLNAFREKDVKTLVDQGLKVATGSKQNSLSTLQPLLSRL